MFSGIKREFMMILFIPGGVVLNVADLLQNFADSKSEFAWVEGDLFGEDLCAG